MTSFISGFMGSGGGATSTVAKQYLYVTMSADQTATLGAGSRIEFDTETMTSGDLTLDAVTNVGRISGLGAGKKYRLTAQIAGVGVSSRLNFAWYDVTNTAYVGNITKTYSPEFNSAGNSNTCICEAIVDGDNTSSVEVRVAIAPNPTTVDIDAAETYAVSYAIIQEI